jgi:Isocitrate/isopropylmalate dehydrogenase
MLSNTQLLIVFFPEIRKVIIIDRKTVTACHKAGVQKMGDGLFINTCREIAKKYPQINYQEEQVDTICMKLARNPHGLDVMVMPNLYGDIVSDLCAGKNIPVFNLN